MADANPAAHSVAAAASSAAGADDAAASSSGDPAAPTSAAPNSANSSAPSAETSAPAATSAAVTSAAPSSSAPAANSSPSSAAPSTSAAASSQPSPTSTQPASTSAPSTSAIPSTSSSSSSPIPTSSTSSSSSSSSSTSTTSSSSSSSSSAPSTSSKPSSTSKPSTTSEPSTTSSSPKSSAPHSTQIVVITSTASDASTPTVFSSTVTGGLVTASSLPPTSHDSNSGGLSTGGKIAIAVVVPVAGVAILICLALFLLKKRRERKLAEEERKQELEEYGFNPNNDVAGGGAAAAAGAAGALAASRGSGPAMDEVSGGYRGWGNTSNHGTKLSTGMTLSDPGSTGSGGATMLEDDLGRPISNGEGFANYAYGPPVASHAVPGQHPAMGGMNRGMSGMEDDGMPASLAINRGPGTAVAAATIPGAGTDLPQGNAAEQGYMGNHNAQGSGESGMYGYGTPGAAAVRRNNTSSSTSTDNLSRDNSGAARPDRSPRRGPSNASSAYSGSAARNSDVSDEAAAFANQPRFSSYGTPGMVTNSGFTQYNTEMPASLHHQQPNPYGQAVDLHIPGGVAPSDAGAGGYQGGYPARAQSGGYDDYDYNDAYRGSQIYGPRNGGNNGGSYVNF